MSDKKINVVLAVSRTGPNGPQTRGDKIEVTVSEASRMLAAGQIEPVDGAAKKELANLKKVEVENRSKAEQEGKDKAAELAEKAANLAAAKAYVARSDAQPDGIDPDQLAEAQSFIAESEA